jgi:NADP-dependent 3-hydroxy acid dehydrogenase YdfG
MGASSFIGAATAAKLPEAGAKVGIAARPHGQAGRPQEADRKPKGSEALVIKMDIVDAGSLEAEVKKPVNACGLIAILVDNAGLTPLSDISPVMVDKWHPMVDVGGEGLLNATATAQPQLRKQQSGHTVDMSSIAGRKVVKGRPVNCATKHAVTAFSRRPGH